MVELDAEGHVHLRFGDDRNGQRPAPGTVFEAVYRVGLGPAGNLGAYALRHAVVPEEHLEHCRRQGFSLVEAKNHLTGGGGLGREPVEKARLFAPEVLRARESLQHCVTERDYQEITERHPDVRRAAARLRWNGSWSVAELYVQKPGNRPVDELFERRLGRYLKPYLPAGCEVKICSPRYVPLDIRLTLWPPSSMNRENVRQKLRDRLTSGNIEILQPDDFIFGRSIYLSELIAGLVALPEIADVEIEVFKRWGQPARGEIEAGVITIQPLEIAQLDNDSRAPHRGMLRVTIGASE